MHTDQDVTDIPKADAVAEADASSLAEQGALPSGTDRSARNAQGSQGHEATAPQAKNHSDEPFSPLELRDRVVIMLLYYETVETEKVEAAWHRWKAMRDQGERELLWRILAEDPAVDQDAIYKVAAQVYAFEEAEIDRPKVHDVVREFCDQFSVEQWEALRRFKAIPIKQVVDANGRPTRIVFATYDPTRPDLHRHLQQLKLERFELRYTPKSLVENFLAESSPQKNEYLERMSDDAMAYDLGSSYESKGEGLIDEEALEAEISRSTLINLFEATLVEAVRAGVSDIHIFPNAERQMEIHFRIDGELRRWHKEERVHPEAFLAVVKDNAMNVDRFERDAAQDGFIQRKIDNTLIRFRVSVLPIANANQDLRSESIVIRVLDDRKVITDLRRLGLLDTALERFEQAIRMPHGMVILTGPTGSGKTTTLFAALHQVISPKVNVLTVEDPVEYIIPGVRQIKLNHKLGLEQAMRAILRHDPDIVMVGEMRDRDTAELAIKLANTGHLTFSTLHTNDAPSAVSRLYKMGLEPFLIAYAINLVVAQRLIRTLCPKCKQRALDPDVELLEDLGFTSEEIANLDLYEPSYRPSCPACKGAGYKGRRAITETMPFSKEIRKMIVAAKEMIDEEQLRDQAIKEGMLTLRMAAREVLKRGETSVEEVVRVTAS